MMKSMSGEPIVTGIEPALLPAVRGACTILAKGCAAGMDAGGRLREQGRHDGVL